MRNAAVGLVLLMSAKAMAMGWGSILPPPVPAHWVDDATSLEPRRRFQWKAISFHGPDEGWIVGNRFLLHVLDGGERLELTFIGELSKFRLNSIQAYGPGAMVTGGWVVPSAGFPPWEKRAYGIVIGLNDGRWSSQTLPDIPLFDWVISALKIDPHGLGWAVGHEQIEEYAPVGRFVLRGEDGQWQLDRSVDHFGEWELFDMCRDARGDWWFVGVENRRPPFARALTVRLHEGQVERIELPPSMAVPSVLAGVACLPDGTLLAAGIDGDSRTNAGIEGRFMRYDPADGAWHDIALPDNLRSARPYSLAAVSATEAWMISAHRMEEGAEHPMFLHWHDGTWDVVPMPPIPGDSQHFTISGMTFVSPDEGWAVGDHYSANRGLIFHYKNGQWRYRAWNWHFWNGTILTLLGD